MSQATYLLHLSDTHLPPESGTLVQRVDIDQALARVLEHINGLPIAPVACIVSGDLTRDGEEEAYLRLLHLLSPLSERGIPVLVGLGNHDSRPNFRAAFPTMAFAFAEPDAPCCYSQKVGDLRVIMLDSHLPGEVRGRLGAQQLAWLDRQLSVPAPGGEILVVHHPVTPPGIPWLDNLLLTDAVALADLLRGRRIIGILSGHCHIGSATTFGGTIAITAPAVAFQFDPFPIGGKTIVHGHGYNLCAMRDGAMTVNPVLLASGVSAPWSPYPPDLDDHRTAYRLIVDAPT